MDPRTFRRTAPAALATALALLTLSSCSTLAETDVEFPGVCFGQPLGTVPGTGGVGGDVTLPPVTVDIGNVPILQDARTRLDTLELQEVRLTPAGGDLSGITEASVTAVPPAGGQGIEAARLRTAGTVLVLQGTGANVASAVQDRRRIALVIHLRGTPPVSDWNADLQTYLRGVVHAEY